MEEFHKLTIWGNNELGKEKIHFSLGELQKHYTFHFGANSRIADFHITNERVPLGQPERHVTLYKISHFRILRLLATFRAEAPNFVHWMLQNEVSVGLLKKKHVALLPLKEENNFMFNISQEEKRNKFRLRKKQFDVDDFIDNLIWPCQIASNPSNIFYAISTRYGILKKRGFILRVKVSERTFRLLWLEEKALLENFQPLIAKILSYKIT